MRLRLPLVPLPWRGFHRPSPSKSMVGRRGNPAKDSVRFLHRCNGRNKLISESCYGLREWVCPITGRPYLSDTSGIGAAVTHRMRASGVKHMQRVIESAIKVVFSQEKLRECFPRSLSQARPCIDEWMDCSDEIYQKTYKFTQEKDLWNSELSSLRRACFLDHILCISGYTDLILSYINVKQIQVIDMFRIHYPCILVQLLPRKLWISVNFQLLFSFDSFAPQVILDWWLGMKNALA